MPDAAPQAESTLSVEEWGQLPADRQGELVDGRLEEEELATIVHEAVVAFLLFLLRSWLGPSRGLVGGSNAKFKVSSRRGRRPDLFVYLPGSRLPRGDAAVVTVPPDLMIEVVSTGRSDQRRDRIDKLTEYEAFGTRYYWLVDPELRSFEVLELGSDGRFVHAVTATTGRVERVPGCKGLVVDLDALWAEVDRFLAASGEE